MHSIELFLSLNLNYTAASSIITFVTALSAMPLRLELGRIQSKISSFFNISGIRSWMLLTVSTASLVMTENTEICFLSRSAYRYNPARKAISAPVD